MAEEPVHSGGLGVEDLITLPVLDEATLLENIKARFVNNLIYVCIHWFCGLTFA